MRTGERAILQACALARSQAAVRPHGQAECWAGAAWPSTEWAGQAWAPASVGGARGGGVSGKKERASLVAGPAGGEG
jgi:hypothetical protein